MWMTALRAAGRWIGRKIAWHLVLKLWGWIINKIWGKDEQS